MPSAEVLIRPEEDIPPVPEVTYTPELEVKQPTPELPTPGPGDFILHRTSKFGHLTLTKMHIRINDGRTPHRY